MHRRTAIALGAVMVALLAGLVGAGPAQANHPVLLEGNCDSPVPGTTIVNIDTCGDYDGDGRIGTAEDTDGADRIFGTLTAALGPGTGAAAGTGINENGSILIVESGRFAEQLDLGIVANPGNITIEAAPGVIADIDAVLQGDPAGGNTARQAGTGIHINMPNDSRVTLRNLEIRNFLTGVLVEGASHVTLEDVILEHNRDYGLRANGTSKVAVIDGSVRGTGFREPVSGPSVPGAGLFFANSSQGFVDGTAITGSFGPGIRDSSTSTVTIQDVRLFDNVPDIITN